jgi:NADH-quinone oxidoreductase subunit J
MNLEAILFAVAAALAVASALLVVCQRSTVTSALFLVVNLGCVAVLLLLLGGQLLAAVQLITHAVAIALLFLLAITLLGPPVPARRFATGPAGVGLSFALAVLFVVALVRAVIALAGTGSSPPAPPGGLVRLLFTAYLYPIQITGVLLLVAMVGAVVLARRQS